MAITTVCSDCGSTLKLADALAGKLVRCPRCKGTTRVDEVVEAVEEVEDERPRRRPIRARDVEDEDRDERPRPRRPRRLSPATVAARLRGPGLILVVLSALGLLGMACNIILSVARIGAHAPARGTAGPGPSSYAIGFVIGTVVGGAMVLTEFLGGLSMLRLSNYGMAKAGAVVALLIGATQMLCGGLLGLLAVNTGDAGLPPPLMFLLMFLMGTLGLGGGFWGLNALAGDDTKRAFD